MKYNTAYPYFPTEEIDNILEEFRNILEGKEVLSMGKKVVAFEHAFAKYVGDAYCVACNSCTASLEIALKSLNVSQGDEVIVPVQTFFASASAVIEAGATPVFCNINEQFLIDFEDLKKKITAKTKAVILVHFAGLIHSEIFEMQEYLRERNIALVEDCAHAHGAMYRGHYAGSFGDFGCFSFFSTKIMTMGEGGALTTNNEGLYKLAKSLRSRGTDVEANVEIFNNFGSNHRITEIQAILGLSQLKYVESFLAQRNKIAQIYYSELRPLYENGRIRFQINPEHLGKNDRHSYWRFIVFLEEENDKAEKIRKNIKLYMKDREISIDWAYAPLVHLQPALVQRFGTLEGFEYSERLSQTHFCLPIHASIKDSDAEYIVRVLLDFFEERM